MKVYSDATETSFFKTDKHIKNLHEIEINSIEDFVFKYSLDSDILMGINCWMVRRFDELMPGNPEADCSDEPDIHGEWVEIDFVADMSYLDILVELSKFERIADSMEEYKNSGIFQSVEQEWVNDDIEKWTITPWRDTRKLELIIDGADNTKIKIIDDV